MDVLLPTSRLRIYVFPLVPGALRLWVWTPMAFMRGDAFFSRPCLTYVAV